MAQKTMLVKELHFYPIQMILLYNQRGRCEGNKIKMGGQNKNAF